MELFCKLTLNGESMGLCMAASIYIFHVSNLLEKFQDGEAMAIVIIATDLDQPMQYIRGLDC